MCIDMGTEAAAVKPPSVVASQVRLRARTALPPHASLPTSSSEGHDWHLLIKRKLCTDAATLAPGNGYGGGRLLLGRHGVLVYSDTDLLLLARWRAAAAAALPGLAAVGASPCTAPCQLAADHRGDGGGQWLDTPPARRAAASKQQVALHGTA